MNGKPKDVSCQTQYSTVGGDGKAGGANMGLGNNLSMGGCVINAGSPYVSALRLVFLLEPKASVHCLVSAV